MTARMQRSVLVSDDDDELVIVASDLDEKWRITATGPVICSTADLVTLRHLLAELIDATERDTVPAVPADPWIAPES